MTDTPTLTSRLAQLGLALPAPPEPIAAYVPALTLGKLILVSGQLPLRDGQPIATGPVTSIEQGREAACQCLLNALAVIQRELDGDWSKLARIVRVVVYVQGPDGYADQPAVANGASELLVQLFGEAGRHVRAAVGVNGLPMNATVELELFAEITGG